MTALLTVLAACLTIIGWTLCSILRDAANGVVIRRRIAEIGEDSERHVAHGECFPHTIFPVHSGVDTL